jgi:hypothetical protein
MNEEICDFRFEICDLEPPRICRFIHLPCDALQFARSKRASFLGLSEQLQNENRKSKIP